MKQRPRRSGKKEDGGRVEGGGEGMQGQGCGAMLAAAARKTLI